MGNSHSLPPGYKWIFQSLQINWNIQHKEMSCVAQKFAYNIAVLANVLFYHSFLAKRICQSSRCNGALFYNRGKKQNKKLSAWWRGLYRSKTCMILCQHTVGSRKILHYLFYTSKDLLNIHLLKQACVIPLKPLELCLLSAPARYDP